MGSSLETELMARCGGLRARKSPGGGSVGEGKVAVGGLEWVLVELLERSGVKELGQLDHSLRNSELQMSLTPHFFLQIF